MWETLLNTKAAGSALSAAFGSDPGNATSGGDFRAFAGAGQGWTVATGKGSASGARLADPIAATYGPGVMSDAPMQAGMSPLLLVVLASIALGLIVRKRG